MKRSILLVLVVFLTLPLVYSAVTFVVQETEKVSIQPNATDPDSDSLIWTYSEPLDENGQWLTTYGDAGQYSAFVSVSDGTSSDSKEVVIIVEKKEEKPKIESAIPSQEEISVDEYASVDFRVLAMDLNNDVLKFSWYVDGKKEHEGDDFTYNPGYDSQGSHEIRVEVSDATSSDSKSWTVNVNDVDVEGLLDSIPDVEINEDEIARLALPDFELYGLAYTISEPIGRNNNWKTGFDDEGIYDIRIHAEGRGFSADKIVKVVVNDVDLPPKFESLGQIVVNEGEEIEIALLASDPDNDEISFSAKNMPKGAKLDENKFTWTPDYDTVKRSGFTKWLMERFGTLRETSYVEFTASAKDAKISQNAIITVRDSNRPPVIEDIAPLKIKEGQTLRLSPKVYDEDGDAVKVKYAGLSDSSTFASGYDDAGTYIFTITATDGKQQVTKDVQVTIEDSNRPPILSLEQEAKIQEGQTLVVLLDAFDADGDIVNYSLDNPPSGSYIKGNAFFWTPDYDTITSGKLQMDLVFVASDKDSESRDLMKVFVENKNRPPTITHFSKSINARVNKPVLMSVEADDEDDDELTYTWNFNMLEKYQAESIQRIFTTSGLKKVKVIVSDGIDEVEQLVTINVV